LELGDLDGQGCPGQFVGRSHSHFGGERAAAIYTIIQTAKLNDINPEVYLKDILTKIADGHPMSKVKILEPRQDKVVKLIYGNAERLRL
jgi:hypothetical protein